MKLTSVVSKLFSTQWFVQPELVDQLALFLANFIVGGFSYSDDKPPLVMYLIDPESGERVQLSYTEASDYSTLFNDAPKGSIAFIPVKGIMLKEDTWFSHGTESIGNLLVTAAKHDNISIAMLDVDTGGGSVDSVPPMIDAINEAKHHVPVYSWADLAASAGYWTISATDYIFGANDISSQFGSIGVMMNFIDIWPYFEKLGFKKHVIYAPESNFKNRPFELALQGKYDEIKSEMLSPLAKRFQKAVRENRMGKVDITQKGILNGRMYFAQDAVRYGLADEIANREKAIKRAVELAKKQ